MDSISPDATPTPDDGRLARGRRRMAELATAYEAERQVEEQALLADLGREPSHAERLLIENASGLAVRARRLRRIGKGRDADSCTMLLTRVLGKLGIRQGSPKPRLSYAERRALEIAAQKAAEGQGVADAARGIETTADSDQRAGGYGAQSAGGAP